MGEHHNNAMAVIKDELGIGKTDGKNVTPINEASLLIVTELARIGHTYLKNAIVDMKRNLDAGDSAITQAEYEHFSTLYNVGFNILAHFDAMCQVIHDEDTAKEKSQEEKEPETPSAEAKTDNVG